MSKIIFSIVCSFTFLQIFSQSTQKACIPPDFKSQIIREVEQSEKELSELGLLRIRSNDPVKFSWPLKQSENFQDNGYHIILQFVDHDLNFGSRQDYNCGSRTYDLSNYNHDGTDIGLWPHRWRKVEESAVEIVAAADGIITSKRDGSYDRNCSWGNNGPANLVYLSHFDGSRTLYLHMKQGSLTKKEIGDSVLRGEYLGVVASSGFSNTPHIHFEVNDQNFKTLDPFFGPCNTFNNSSLWIDQPPYFDPAINKVMTHSQIPRPYSACPNVEELYAQNQFNPGDQVFFATYFRDQRKDQISKHHISQPNGTEFTSWSHSSPGNYISSHWYWDHFIPTNAETGTWKYQVQFENDTVTHNFMITNDCLEPLNLSARNVKSRSVELEWNFRNNTEYILRYKSNDKWDTILVDTSYVLVEGLAPDTQYQWEVLSVCSPGDSSIFASGPPFTTISAIQFEGQKIVISPSSPTSSDVIDLMIIGVVLEEGGTLDSSYVNIVKNEIQVTLDWGSSNPDPIYKLDTIKFSIPPLAEGSYFIILLGKGWEFHKIPEESYSLIIQNCQPGKDTRVEPFSATKISLVDYQYKYVGNQIISYKPVNSKTWKFDTVFHVICIKEPCFPILTSNLMFYKDWLLVKNLNPCTEYEFRVEYPCLDGDRKEIKLNNVMTSCQIISTTAPFNVVKEKATLTSLKINWDDTARNSYLDGYSLLYKPKDQSYYNEIIVYGSNYFKNEEIAYHRPDYLKKCSCPESCRFLPVLTPPLHHVDLRGLIPCTEYEFKISKLGVDSTTDYTSSFFTFTDCSNDPYMSSSTYSNAMYSDAAGVKSFKINEQYFINNCLECEGCKTPGYIFMDSLVTWDNELEFEFEGIIIGDGIFGDYTDELGRLSDLSFTPYLDLDRDGIFEYQALRPQRFKPGNSHKIKILSPEDAVGMYRLRCIFSFLDEPKSQGRYHYGQTVDVNVSIGETTGISNVDQNPFKVYPNPFSESINLENISGIPIVEIRIMDIYGKMVFHDLKINTSHLREIIFPSINSGLYFMELKFAKSSRVIKIYKQ